ncbi:unnamed protein product [Mesocestoides corti]|uniref:WKF domain-containing protein n=1 Tax=Mesocestoides corti TaxID=53468 RepID=A0A0R3UEY7_MESCO|nr:unnamed protein product [Mesocestoides corti]
MGSSKNKDSVHGKKRKVDEGVVVNEDATEAEVSESPPLVKKRKKSVAFAVAAAPIVDAGSSPVHQPASPKRRPEFTILKGPKEPAETAGEADEENQGSAGEQSEKPKKTKKSKNALKRIKWAKRRAKRTTSRRRRKANRELAKSRPQRDAEEHVAEAIDYLNRWHSSPETWKYKKVAQLTLIKHAFNRSLIDDENFELLSLYLAGMQGGAAARLQSLCQHLVDNAGVPPESPTLPLAIPETSLGSSTVIKRAKRMLDCLQTSSPN